MTNIENEPTRASEQYSAAPKTNTLAIISLVSAFFVCLPAVITGHLALGQIRRTGEGGQGLAVAGLVLGYLGMTAATLTVTIAIVFAATLIPVIVAAVNGTAVDPPSISATNEPQTDRQQTDVPDGDAPQTLPTGILGAAHFGVGTSRSAPAPLSSPTAPSPSG